MIKLPLATSTWNEKEVQAIQKVIKNKKYTMGPIVKKFEKSFANFFGSKFAVMTNSGSTANLLMVGSLFMRKKLNIKRGDEVIVPAVSWSTTYFPFHQYGLKLVFVDIDINTLNLSLEKLEKAITKKTKVICAVNLLGNPNNFTAIKRIARKNKIIVLEDNCESMGAKFKKKFTGTHGLMGTFSTFFSHHISTIEGGLIVTDNVELYHILLSLRAHGWTRDLPENNLITGKKSNDSFFESFNFVLPGYNVRPLEISGAIGIEQLKKINSFLKIRRENAKYFKSLFTNHPYILTQKECGQSSWFGFSLIIKKGSNINRKDIVTLLKKNKVEVRPIVTGNFLKQPALKYLDYRVSGKVLSADYIDKNGIYIGNHPFDIKNKLKKIADLLS